MKKAKITAALLAGALVLGLTSCGASYSKYFDDNGYYEGVKASETVTLPQYKGIEVKKSEITVTDAEVEEYMSQLQGSSISYEQVYDREVKDGDTLNIDYVGSIDGVEFEGGSTGGQGTDVTIGVTQFIDDFLYQLIGHKPGETVNVEVTFPENYGVEELNGKDALFVTKINYIRGLPKDLDALAKNYGFETGEELRNDIVKFIEESKASNIAAGVYAQAVCEKVPSKAVKFQKILEEESLTQYVVQQGKTVSQYLMENGYTSMGAYLNTLENEINLAAAQSLAIQAIAELENITVTDEEFNAKNFTEEDIKTYGEPYLRNYMLKVKVDKFIIDSAVIVDDTVIEESGDEASAPDPEGTDTTAPEGETAAPEDETSAEGEENADTAADEQPIETVTPDTAA